MEKELKNKIENKKNEDQNFKFSQFKINPIAYLYMCINVIVVIGAAITFIFFHKSDKKPDEIKINLISLIFNFLAIFLLAIFLFFETRNILAKKFHINHKWYKFFIASVILFAIMCSFSTIICNWLPLKEWKINLNLIITMTVSLICIGLYWYARFHIDKDIFQRMHGCLNQSNSSKLTNCKSKDEIKNKTNINETKSLQNSTSIRKKDGKK